MGGDLVGLDAEINVSVAGGSSRWRSGVKSEALTKMKLIHVCDVQAVDNPGEKL
jgi:hypothetical protein